ncbi:GntP family permease [Flagellimonas halotolerans]|uniref:GntP family permease n=1 Tax=Flagellimonas halotolerans TaxID=3112164 RepID=A0ABU6IUM3_9FLAO|nr:MULTISPECIES: GntP family permease [unclassified Allomuricauda]MEC3966900.1 GntP family permease [Muricauda sp. SYSU M86414]MEC4266781.1 GntP family permease [Muricauda sp. SYSU M84420]
MEILVLGVVVLFIIIATVKFKMHPVFSLTIAAVASGFLLGITPKNIMSNMAEGFGKTLSGIGLVIAFGTVIGVYLEKTGSTQVLANSILKVIGLKRSPLAMNLAGFVISIPVYCDSGYIILSSLNKAISKKTGIPALVFAIALATGLYSAHVFVPPTPGPLAAAAILDADLGMVLIFGLLVAIPVSVSGYFWARFIGRSLKEDETAHLYEEKEAIQSTVKPFQAFLPLLVPIILIAMKSIVDYPTHPLGEGWLFRVFDFFGNPVIALLIGVFFAFALSRNVPSEEKKEWVPEAFKQAGAIVLITGTGGAFGAILRTMDIASIINLESSTGIGGLLIAFVIAAVLKTAQGSSTVAIITTSAIIAPLLETFGLVSITDKALAVLAIGAGAMTVSHINDSYFWVVSQFSNMNVKTALRGHTMGTLLQGTVGILMILLLYFVV